MNHWLMAVSLILSPTVVVAHDMFLVLDAHFVAADSPVTVSLYNGTFDRSENTIDRDRMLDVSVIDGDGALRHPPADQWREEGEETLLDFRAGSPGTYVVGVSTRPRMIELSAEDFNEYLQHDGVLDVLEARRRQAILDRPAAEKYSKHVKTILQVGEPATETYSRRLGYPIEIVPLANPAVLSRGDSLALLVLADGEPVAGQLVYASYAGFRGGGNSGEHREATATRTDASGVARIDLTRAGRWYARLIRMTPSDEEGVDYESNWATLTFEIR